MEKKIGEYSFVIGVIVAIVLGLIADRIGGSVGIALSSLLVLLGLIVGFLNVTSKESKEFILLTVALVIMAGLAGATLANIEGIGKYIAGIFQQLMIFLAPASVVVALKAIMAMARKK